MDEPTIATDPSTVTDKNLFAYCDNDPINRRDDGGQFWDTLFDVASLVSSVVEVAANPANPFAWGALAADAVSLVLPGVTGGGKIVRFVANADNILDATKYADEVVDGSKAMTSSLEAGQKLHKQYNPIKETINSGQKSFNTSISKLNPKSKSRLRPDAIDFQNRIIYELKPYNKRSFKRAIKQTNKYAKELGGEWTIVIDMYKR